LDRQPLPNAPRRLLVCLGVALAAALLAACGGRTELDGGAGSGSGSGSGSGGGNPGLDGGASWGQPDGSGPWSAVCPESAPDAGSACSTEGAYCEYGDAWWDVSCDTVVECTGGAWQTAAVSEETCFPAPGANPGSCPASPSTIPDGAPCRVPGLACYYGLGAVCACSIPGGPGESDGGSEWSCGPDPGCPSSRPRLGAPCTGNQICEYDDASGFAEVCQGGTWGPSEVGN
jgi:hypothetical protein